ncbi:hypothetical protein NQD34_009272 [Periophthalmus magnuspinnatus]|nr:hypothetical protein NQD34_009272 [Periophthalmus magnuspinnatus]
MGNKTPPPDWPSKGLVTFDGVSFSYSVKVPWFYTNSKPRFHLGRRCFLKRSRRSTVTSRGRCNTFGIVGRTGAGKSALVSALFRLSEPKGKIYIDGVLTSELHHLHRRRPSFLR